jgi:hypothetical protein
VLFGQKENIVNKKFVKPDSKKIEFIKNLFRTKNIKDIKSFLEFLNYYCRGFIKNLADKSKQMLGF